MSESLPPIPPNLVQVLLKRFPEVRDSAVVDEASLRHKLAQREFVLWLHDQSEEQQRTRY